jgi:hypothetical protein
MNEIITVEEYETKMSRLWALLEPGLGLTLEPGTPEGEEAETLSKQIMAYEAVKYPMTDPVTGNQL